MNITLMAHDKKKELMVQFCTAYKSILSKHSLSATAATGRLVSEATNLPVALFLSKNQGGHQQVDARIAYNEIDLVIMFSDPNDNDPWEDQRIPAAGGRGLLKGAGFHEYHAYGARQKEGADGSVLHRL